MPQVHRENDLRVCDAKTIVTGQSTVRAGGELIAVLADKCNHNNGDFIENGRTLRIGGKCVIAIGDHALGDSIHIPPLTDAKTGIATVIVG